MATTITRFTLNDDSGTPDAPVGDGTTINNDTFQNIFDEIDALLAGSVTVGGTLGAQGFGAHTFSSGGTGGNSIQIRNTTAGAGNFSALVMGNDASSNAAVLYTTSSTFTPAGVLRQDGAVLVSSRAGGLSLAALSGQVRVSGTGTVTTGVADADSKQAMLRLNDMTGGTGSGGGIEFGADFKYYGAIKGLLANGGTNTIGDIAFFTRNTVSAASLAESMRIQNDGNVFVGGLAPVQRADRRMVVSGVGSTATTSLPNSDARTNSLLLTERGGAGGSGGLLEFGSGYGVYGPSNNAVTSFAAIKGAAADGGGNSLGELGFYVRVQPNTTTSMLRVFRLTTTGQAVFTDGDDGSPAIAFGGGTSGMFHDTGTVYISTNGRAALSVSTFFTNSIGVGALGGAFGTGATPGAIISAGSNLSGSGAAGALQLQKKGGSVRYIWVDNTGSDVVRINGNPPTENDASGFQDTGGTVVGAQTSRRELKEDIERFEDYGGALQTILDTPLSWFRYKGGGYGGTRFLGIIADEAPHLVMDPEEPDGLGRLFSPVSAFGYLAASVKELTRRIAELEMRLQQQQEA